MDRHQYTNKGIDKKLQSIGTNTSRVGAISGYVIMDSSTSETSFRDAKGFVVQEEAEFTTYTVNGNDHPSSGETHYTGIFYPFVPNAKVAIELTSGSIVIYK